MEANDDQLWQVCRRLPSDFEPYGERKRDGQSCDCSGCRWFQPLLRSGVLDWGTCANDRSSRAGLLTYREQGCESFEKTEEQTDDETWRNRAEFKNRIEDILVGAHGQYIHIEVGKLNDPGAQDIFWLDHFESSIQRALDMLLCRLFEGEATFDRVQAAEEVTAEVSQRHETAWESGRRACERILKRRFGERASGSPVVRLPDDIQSLDDEFWRRVMDTIRDALEQKG